MSFLVCSFLALIPFSYRHHHVSLKFKTKQNKTFRFGLFPKRKEKKDPKGYTLHLKVPTRGHDILPVREWMTEKEREKHTRTHSRDMADSFHKSSIGGGMGDCWSFFFFFIAPTIVSNCHHILSASGNTATKETEENKQSSIVRLSQWPWKIFPPITRWPGPQALCRPHPHRLLCLQNDQKASMVTGLSLYSSSDLLGGIHLF